MTSRPRILNNTILRTWIIAAVCCTIVATFGYNMMPPERGNSVEQGMAYFLFPGVALYTLLNGSLLFGSGFGKVGNFLVIGLSSGIAWSFVVVLLVQGISWLWHRYGR